MWEILFYIVVVPFLVIIALFALFFILLIFFKLPEWLFGRER
jgi:hypothetical protein